MSKRNEPQQAFAGIAGQGGAPPQAQVEAAMAKVLDAVVPARQPRQSNGGALKRAEEIGRPLDGEKPAR